MDEALASPPRHKVAVGVFDTVDDQSYSNNESKNESLVNFDSDINKQNMFDDMLSGLRGELKPVVPNEVIFKYISQIKGCFLNRIFITMS